MAQKIEDFLKYNEKLGIYDFIDSEFLQELKKLEYENQADGNYQLDLLAKEVYGDEQFWWVIAYYNDIIDPINYDNATLYLPSLNDVEDLIIKFKEGS